MFGFFFFNQKRNFKIYKYDRFWTEFDASKKIIIINKKTFNNINSTELFLKKPSKLTITCVIDSIINTKKQTISELLKLMPLQR